MKEARQKMQVGISELMENMDLHIRVNLAKAKLCRAYYLQLIEEGFSNVEALELCKYFQG